MIDEETVNISVRAQENNKKTLAKQFDPEHLAKQRLPPVPKSFDGPIIQRQIENCRNNLLVITNEEHSKATNNGYKRNPLDGRFFST